MSAKAAQLLREAADHIDKVGFNQDGNFYAQQYDRDVLAPTDERPCCTVGALMVATRKHDVILSNDPWSDTVGIKYQALGELARAIDPDAPAYKANEVVVNWSDHSSTTQEKVLELLRTTADRIEKGSDQ